MTVRGLQGKGRYRIAAGSSRPAAARREVCVLRGGLPGTGPAEAESDPVPAPPRLPEGRARPLGRGMVRGASGSAYVRR